MKIKRIWRKFNKHYGIPRLLEALWTIGPLIGTLTTKTVHPEDLRITCCLIGGLLLIYGTHLDIKSDKKNDTKFTQTYIGPYDMATSCGMTLLLITLYL